MKIKYILLSFICFVVCLGLKAQTTPVIRLDSVEAIASYKAYFQGYLVSRGSWTGTLRIGFIYAPVNNPNVGDTNIYSKSASSSTTEYHYTTSSNYYLKPNTQYWVKAFVSKGNGSASNPYDSVFSYIKYLTTGVDTCTISSMDTVFNIGLTDATVAGKVIQKGDAYILSSAGFIYDTTPNPTMSTPGATVIVARTSSMSPSSLPLPIAKSVTNLLSGVTYYVRVWTANKYTNSYSDTCYSEQIAFNTLHSCSSVPYYLDTVSVGINDVQLKWIPNIGQRDFEVDYGFAGHEVGQGTLQRVSDTTIHLTGLASNRTYTSYVRAVCGNIYSDWSTLKSFKTHESPCENVSSIHTESIDYFTAKLVWTPGSSSQNTWDVLFAQTSSPYPETPYTVTGEPEYIPVGLAENTNYKIKIRGNCNAILSDWSNEYTFKTTAAGIEDAQGNKLPYYIMVYPNPTKGIINFDGNLQDVMNVEIYSFIGKLVYSSDAMPKKIDLTNQDSGLYTLLITTPMGVQIEKIIINKS